MGENSKIEWTDHTFNPWIGCTQVSPGCDHCYAKTLMQDRWHKVTWGNGQQRVRTKSWLDPVRWDDRARASGVRERVFCASLADVFDSEVPNAWRDDLFETILMTPHLDWLLLTKRPEIAKRYDHWFEERNIWLGVSVENQEMSNLRVYAALKIAPRVFLSIEPLLGPVTIPDLPDVGWAIVGGESGPGYRPMDAEWARSIRDQCDVAGTPFFMKQMAGKGPIPADLLIRQTPWEAD